MHHKVSFLQLYCGYGRKTHSSEGEQNVAFFRFFELKDILGKSPRVSAGAPFLSLGLFLRSVLKFHSVRTALMRTFDLHFIQRWTFVVSDVCLTQRSSCESYSSKWSHNFCGLPWNRYRFWRLSVLKYATQLSHTFHNSYCTFVTTLFGLLLGCSSTFQMRKWALCAKFTSRVWLIKLTFGMMPIIRKWFGANAFQEVVARLASPLVLLFLDTLLPRVFEYCGERMVSVSHDRYSHAGNCISLPSNTDLFSVHW